MSDRGKHIGLYLDISKPVDKKIIDIFSDLPQGDNITTFIKKAIIYYGTNKSAVSSDTAAKIDRIYEILTSGAAPVSSPDFTPSQEEPKRREKKADPVKEAKKKEEPKAGESKAEPEEEELTVDASNNISEEDYDTFMADFFSK